MTRELPKPGTSSRFLGDLCMHYLATARQPVPIAELTAYITAPGRLPAVEAGLLEPTPVRTPAGRYDVPRELAALLSRNGPYRHDVWCLVDQQGRQGWWRTDRLDELPGGGWRRRDE